MLDTDQGVVHPRTSGVCRPSSRYMGRLVHLLVLKNECILYLREFDGGRYWAAYDRLAASLHGKAARQSGAIGPIPMRAP